MKCGARVAIGVAGGYFLGRTKKMKLALMLAGMAAGRRAGGAGALLGRARSLLNASPELSGLSTELTGRLLDAGKGAALAVATRQVESLTERVAGRVEDSLGSLGGRERSSKDAERARDEADEDYERKDQKPQDTDAEDVPAGVGARSDATGDARPTRARAGSAARRTEGGARAAKGAAGTAVRRAAGAASGSRRTAERTAGRPGRARRRDDGG